jgi:nucleoside-diphosphate-sugar epimerase
MAPRQPVLVTGGAGYIGGQVVRQVRAAGRHAVAHKDLWAGFAWAVLEAEVPMWRPRQDDLERIGRAACTWEQRLRRCGGPGAFGAAYRASPIVALRAH